MLLMFLTYLIFLVIQYFQNTLSFFRKGIDSDGVLYYNINNKNRRFVFYGNE